MVTDENSITIKQIHFIHSLSESDHYFQYPSRLKNPDILDSFLRFCGKSLDELSVKQGTELIKVLLDNTEISFMFPCGLKSWVNRDVAGRSYVMGELDSCLHDCPDKIIGGDVNNCPYWVNHEGD
jgi:hypothetical protein